MGHKSLRMTSYLRSWLIGPQSTPEPKKSAPEIEIVEPQIEDDDKDEDDGYDTDRPPMFPALNSAQRASGSSTNERTKSKSSMMMPPPVPRFNLSVTPAMTSSDGSLAPLATTQVAKKSKKVALAPGHSTLDWANLKNSGEDLRVSFLGPCPISHSDILIGRSDDSDENYTLRIERT